MQADAIFAELSLSEWRDKQMTAVSDQLTAAYPDLEREIDAYVDALSIPKLAMLPIRLNQEVKTRVWNWAAVQLRAAIARAEDDLHQTLEGIEFEPGIDGKGLAQTLASTVGLGGAMMTAAGFALPVTLALATTTGTSLFFLSTASVSVPVVFAGGAVASALLLTGSRKASAVVNKGREQLRRNAHEKVRVAVFGATGALEEKSVLNVIQAEVLAEAAKTVQEAL